MDGPKGALMLCSRSLRWLAVVSLLTLAAACGARSAGGARASDVRFETYGDATTTFSPMPAEAVRVYTPGDFPDGFAGVAGGGRMIERVALRPDYPTAEEPHRILGALGLEPTSRESIDDAVARLVAAAAEHGANALILLERSSGVVGGLALRLSDAHPVWEDADALLANAEVPEGYTRWGERQATTLEAFQPVEIQASRGNCYAITFALGADAALSEHARRGLRYSFGSGDPDIAQSSGSIAMDIPLDMRSHTRVIGCPQVDGAISIDLQAFFGASVSTDRVHELGTGPLFFQIYRRPLGRQELTQRAQESQRLRDEARARTQGDCRLCAAALASCGRGGRCRAYDDCLRRQHLRAADCH